MTLKGYLTLAAVLEREHFDFDAEKAKKEIKMLRSELMEDVIRYNTLSVDEKKQVLSVLMDGMKEETEDDKCE
jgi:hypothetical protein